MDASASPCRIRSARAPPRPTSPGRGCSIQQAETQLRNLELQIATQVRDRRRGRCRRTRSASRAPGPRASWRSAGSRPRRRSSPPASRRASSSSRRSAIWRRRAPTRIRAAVGLQQVDRRLRGGAGGAAAGRRASATAGRIGASAGTGIGTSPATVAAPCPASLHAPSLPAPGRPSSPLVDSRVPKLSVTVITKNEAADIARRARVGRLGRRDHRRRLREHRRHRGDRAAVHRAASSSAPWPGYVAQKNHAASLATPRLDPVARRRRARDAGARAARSGSAARIPGARGVPHAARDLAPRPVDSHAPTGTPIISSGSTTGGAARWTGALRARSGDGRGTDRAS